MKKTALLTLLLTSTLFSAENLLLSPGALKALNSNKNEKSVDVKKMSASGQTLLNQEEIKKRATLNELEQEIKSLQTQINVINSRSLFIQKQKKIFVTGNQQWVTLHVPINQIITTNFDQSIKKITYLPNKNVEVSFKDNKSKHLSITNKDPYLKLNIKIEFINGRVLNVLYTTGENSSKRYIEYNVYTDKYSLNTLKSFQKKLKIRNIHNYFNSVAIKLILDRLNKKGDYQVLIRNKFDVNELIFSGEGKLDTIMGKVTIPYSVTLLNTYETPYIQSDDEKNAKRLVLLEVKILNKSKKDIFIVNENFIKKRFNNYVAFYLGNIELKENYIKPEGSMNALLVIEDIQKEK